MDDLISRQSAIEVCMTYNGVGWVWSEILDELKELPSAERHGKWIHDGYDFPHGVDWMHCSECGKRDVYCPAARTNFCPNCGARMDGD